MEINWLILFVGLVVCGGQIIEAKRDDLFDSYEVALEDLKELELLSANLEHLQPSKIVCF